MLVETFVQSHEQDICVTGLFPGTKMCVSLMPAPISSTSTTHFFFFPSSGAIKHHSQLQFLQYVTERTWKFLNFEEAHNFCLHLASI